MLMIAGESLRSDPLGGAWDAKRSTYDEIDAKDVALANQSSGRRFDPRLRGSWGKYWLTGTQLRQPLAVQLSYWCESLLPLSDKLQSASRIGAWIVIDCQASRKSTSTTVLQYQIPSKPMKTLGDLGVSVEIVIWQ